MLNTIKNVLNTPLVPGSIATIKPDSKYEKIILSGCACPFCCKNTNVWGGIKVNTCEEVVSERVSIPKYIDFFAN